MICICQERDSGSSSLKTVSEVSSEDIQPIKNSPSKYNDPEPSKSAVNRLVPIIPATDFVDISSSSESESDDGIQVVEHHETRQVRFFYKLFWNKIRVIHAGFPFDHLDPN